MVWGSRGGPQQGRLSPGLGTQCFLFFPLPLGIQPGSFPQEQGLQETGAGDPQPSAASGPLHLLFLCL